MERGAADFQFIEALPGKRSCSSNHDFWWSTAKRPAFAAHDMHTMDIPNNNCYFYAIMPSAVRGWFMRRPGARRTTEDHAARGRQARTSLKAAGPGRSSSFRTTRRSISATVSEIPDLLDAYHCRFAAMDGHSRGCRSLRGMYHDTEFRLLSADYISFCPRRIPS